MKYKVVIKETMLRAVEVEAEDISEVRNMIGEGVPEKSGLTLAQDIEIECIDEIGE